MSKLHPAAQFVFALLLVAIGITSCIVWGFEKGGYILAGAVGGTILGVFWFGIAIWRISHTTITKIVYLALIGVAGMAAVPALIPPLCEFILSASWPTLRAWLPHLPEQPPTYTIQQTWPALIFLLLFSWLVLHYLRPRDVTGTARRPLKDDFPAEPSFPQQMEMFAGHLADDLAARDRETNWSHSYFTPLEAEVEIQGRRRRELTDLLTAMRNFRKSRAFLVLGDPGSGKSVSLRQLTRELLKEVPRTGHIPLYVNLREWKAEPGWTNDNLPPVSKVITSLHQFIKTNVSDRLDVFGQKFIASHFDQLLATGRLFLILDSFDEIDVLLDTSERAPLVRLISDALGRLMRGPQNGRGILASRVFRRPTDEFNAESRIEIRPLTDARVQIFIRRRFEKRGDEILRTLFTTRPDLLSAARNPFSAALLMDYIEHHTDDKLFPPHRAELYEDYTRQRIREGTALARRSCHAAPLWELCCHLGQTMLQRAALEIPAPEIEAYFSHDTPADAIEILTRCRILRTGCGTELNVSFSHRRFAEFFAATALLEAGDALPLDAIPSDSRWRDTLVIYCEICPDEIAHEIGNLCWKEISPFMDNSTQLSHERRLRAIHCMRFLADAFPLRKDACNAFAHELGSLLIQTLDNRNDILVCKLSVETAGIAPDALLPLILSSALTGRNEWISETAFHACRRTTSYNHTLESALVEHIHETSLLRMLISGHEYSSSLGMCPHLKRVSTLTRILRIESLSLLLFFLFLLSSLFFGSIPPPIPLLSILVIISIELISNSSPFLILTPSKNFQELRSLQFSILLLSTPLFIHHYESTSLLFYISCSAVGIIYRIRHFGNHGRFCAALTQNLEGLARSVPLIILLIASNYCLLVFAKPLYLTIGSIIITTTVSLTALCLLLFLILCSLDYRHVRNFYPRESLSRNDIAISFKLLHSPYGRRLFIDRLKDSHLKPTGEWPGGRAPNRNDIASTMLAKLEEKWLQAD